MPRKYRWEAGHIAIIGSVILVLTLVKHLTPQPDRTDRPPPGPATASEFHGLQSGPHGITSAPAEVPHQSSRRAAQPFDPNKVVVGPNSISGQFILLGADRKRSTATSDELTIRLRVVSRAVADLVTPFQSAMLEVRSPGLEPINPQRPFSHPVPAGDSHDEDIVFIIPSNLSPDRTVLRVHYFNDEKEIPLHVPSHADPR